MKLTVLLILLSFPSMFWSQITVTSPYTQYFPSGIIEDINRSITITDNDITIASDTQDGKDIQTLLVQLKILNENDLPVYFCTSKDGLFKTVIVLNLNDPPYLDIFEPEGNNSNIIQHFRMLLD